MKIDVITHSGKGIGLGHLSRTLALAEGFRQSSDQIRFILPDTQGVDRIAHVSDRVCIAPDRWPYPHVDGPYPDLYIIDHYVVNEMYFRSIGNNAAVMYIDDLCQTVMPVSIVHNGHFYGSGLPYGDRAPRALHLLGPEYFLLRRGAFSRRQNSSVASVSDILITTGGTDPFNQTPVLVDALREIAKAQGIRLHVILGEAFEYKDSVRSLADVEAGIIVHEGLTHLDSVIVQCQLGIAPSGTTLYEMAAYGVPAITWQMVPNQRYVFESVVKGGYGYSMDPFDPEALSDLVARLVKDTVELSDISGKLRQRVDGMGVERTVNAVVGFLKEGGTV